MPLKAQLLLNLVMVQDN